MESSRIRSPSSFSRAIDPFQSRRQLKISNDFLKFIPATCLILHLTFNNSENRRKVDVSRGRIRRLKWKEESSKNNGRKFYEVSSGDFGKKANIGGGSAVYLNFHCYLWVTMPRPCHAAEDRVVRSVWKRRMKRNYYSNWQHELTIRRPGRRRSWRRRPRADHVGTKENCKHD